MAASALPFAGSLSGGFVWDDRDLIVENRLVAEPLAASSLPRFVAGDFWAGGAAERQSGYYRPLTLFSYALQRAISGLHPRPFRLANVALHAATTLLLFSLATRLSVAPTAAFGTALLFAVHPAHVESVAWISGRTDLLATLLALAALRAALGPPLLWPAIVVLQLGSLLAKESAALVPLLVLLSPAFGNLARRLTSTAAFTLATCTYLTLRLRALPPPSAGPGGLLEVAGDAGKHLLVYAGKVLWPRHLPLALDVAPAGAAAPLFALLFLLAFGGAAILASRQRAEGGLLGEAVGAGLLLFVLGLVPVLGFVPIHDASAVRFLYLPSGGLLMALVPLAASVAARLHPRAPGSLLALAAIGLSVMTARRSADFTSDEALFGAERRLSPGSVTMAMNLGEAYRRSGRADAAADYYDELAVELPSAETAVARVRSLREAGRLDASAAAAKEAAARYDGDASLHAELGLTLIAQGYPTMGREELQRSVDLDPAAVAPRFNLALAFTQLGRSDEALAAVAPGLERAPESTELNLVKALALRRAGRHTEAIPILEGLTRRVPERKEPWIELGDACFAVGMYEQSRRSQTAALALDPGSTRALSSLALLDLTEGKLDDAADRQGRVVAARPDDVDARANLAAILVRKGDRAGAARELREILRRNPDHPGAASIARQVATLEAGTP